jgi:hypothetical protein
MEMGFGGLGTLARRTPQKSVLAAEAWPVGFILEALRPFKDADEAAAIPAAQ